MKKKVLIALAIFIPFLVILYFINKVIKNRIGKLSIEKGINPYSGLPYSELEIEYQVNFSYYITIFEEALKDCYLNCETRCRNYKKIDTELGEAELKIFADLYFEKHNKSVVEEIKSRWRTGCGYGIAYDENIINRLSNN